MGASVCAWYLGSLFAESVPEDTLSAAIDNIQRIGEKPIVRAPPPKRQKCDHWSPCPHNHYAFRVLSGAAKDRGPKICFEDEMIMSIEQKNVDRGLNVAVVDAKTGKVQATKSFDLWGGDNSPPMIEFINSAPSKSYILIASYDDAFTRLTEDAKNLLEKLGSKDIRKLNFRANWVFVASKDLPLPSDLKREKVMLSDQANRYGGWPAEVVTEGCLPHSD